MNKPAFTVFVLLTGSLLLTSCTSMINAMEKPSMRTMIIAMNVATIVDVESTYLVMRRCPNCVEANPLMRPAVNRGRVVTYGVQFTLNALIARRARQSLIERMARPDDAALEKNAFWYYLPYSLATSHYLAGALNFRLARQY